MMGAACAHNWQQMPSSENFGGVFGAVQLEDNSRPGASELIEVLKNMPQIKRFICGLSEVVTEEIAVNIYLQMII